VTLKSGLEVTQGHSAPQIRSYTPTLHAF